MSWQPGMPPLCRLLVLQTDKGFEVNLHHLSGVDFWANYRQL